MPSLGMKAPRPNMQGPMGGTQQGGMGGGLESQRSSVMDELYELQSRLMRAQMTGANPMEIANLKMQMQRLQDSYNREMQMAMYEKQMRLNQPNIGQNHEGPLGTVGGNNTGALMQHFMAMYGLPSFGGGGGGYFGNGGIDGVY